jgi:hypothetical protein
MTRLISRGMRIDQSWDGGLISRGMTIEELLGALKPFDNLRGWIPVRYVTTFLMVALDEGKWPSAYARGAGMDRISMSRCLRDIGERSRTGGPGLGLVKAVRDPSNLHRRRVLLTEKGRALLLLVTGSLSTIEPDRNNVVCTAGDAET